VLFRSVSGLSGYVDFGDIAFSLPLLTSSGAGLRGIIGSASPELPALLTDADGLRGIVGSAELKSILNVTDSTGTIYINPSGSAEMVLPVLGVVSASGTIYVNLVGSAAMASQFLYEAGEGLRGLVGSASLSDQLLYFTGTPIINQSGETELELPLLDVIGSGLVQDLVEEYDAPIRRGFVMNLVNWAITEYTDYSFNSFAYFNGVPLGASEKSGICVLEGDRDDGNQIRAYYQEGVEDLFANFINRISHAWITSRQDGQLKLMAIMDEEESTPEEFIIESSDDEMHEERIKFPKSLKNRFLSIRVENVEGSKFSVDKVRVFLEPLSRKR
jgi:hypothetical protein